MFHWADGNSAIPLHSTESKRLLALSAPLVEWLVLSHLTGHGVPIHPPLCLPRLTLSHSALQHAMFAHRKWFVSQLAVFDK